MKKNTSFLYSIYIAHRGLHDEQTIENTMSAFQKSLSKNIPIELDIHLLKDGKVIVFHDDTLNRVFHVDRKLKDCTYEEIKVYAQKENIQVPLLEDVLSLVNGKVLLDIEFKYDVMIGKLEKKAVSLLDDYNGPFIVKSFHPLTVLWFRIYRNHYIRGQLAEKNKKRMGFLTSNMWFHFLTKPDFIAYKKEESLSRRVQKLRKKVPLLLYTIRSKEEMRNYDSYGDGYICENIL